ncbi:uncharacterized protein LOC123299886 [Chrysoperla carnea]|uniref:uncharacterized protein LOC123299886 n=1 Tax=Chrysoperla carnea TaxID=189513 RepID=UPI001D07B777|nr:uncharacterized protein LOC123299886 [Chrysoperla carnea]XP_044738225.1 uncharacterized protein LOC123299886 [Chrysoperla carnea]
MATATRLLHPHKTHHLYSITRNILFSIIIFSSITWALPPSIISNPTSTSSSASVEDVHVECTSSHMIIHIRTGGDYGTFNSEEQTSDDTNSLLYDYQQNVFNGLVYPKGLSRNSTCMTEYIHQKDPIVYRLPLRSCNTMSSQMDDGSVEYFNTIVVQPHLKLVTNQGRDFIVRCKDNNPEKIIVFNEPFNTGKEPKPLPSISELPRATMKIFYGDPNQNEIAANVKIGDPLSIVVALEKQNDFGIKVSDCLVKDGLGWGEQRLINTDGCPVDGEIMGMFSYNEDRTRAEVHFQAHKFPYTKSVYYQCNVKLCLKIDGKCEKITPPNCAKNRGRRQAKDANDGGVPATIEVFSGLYVNEANDLSKIDPYEDDVIARKNPEDSICVSQRTFAIAISVAGLILMLCVVLAIIILLARRRTKKVSSVPGSSIYSGPYTNTAYSHTS